MSVKDYHGKSPEETFANYMGYEAGGKKYGWPDFLSFNKNVEMVPESLSASFVQDRLEQLKRLANKTKI